MTDLNDLLEYTSGREELKNSDLVTVLSLNLGSGYSWNEFHAFYSPSRRRFFWASAAGCSCNSWSDYVGTLDDFENGLTRADVMSALNRWFDEEEASPDIRVRALAEINSFSTVGLS